MTTTTEVTTLWGFIDQNPGTTIILFWVIFSFIESMFERWDERNKCNCIGCNLCDEDYDENYDTLDDEQDYYPQPEPETPIVVGDKL